MDEEKREKVGVRREKVGGWVGRWSGSIYLYTYVGFGESALALVHDVEAKGLGEEREGFVRVGLEKVGGWVGRWVGWMEESEAVRMSYCEL